QERGYVRARVGCHRGHAPAGIEREDRQRLPRRGRALERVGGVGGAERVARHLRDASRRRDGRDRRSRRSAADSLGGRGQAEDAVASRAGRSQQAVRKQRTGATIIFASRAEVTMWNQLYNPFSSKVPSTLEAAIP